MKKLEPRQPRRNYSDLSTTDSDINLPTYQPYGSRPENEGDIGDEFTALRPKKTFSIPRKAFTKSTTTTTYTSEEAENDGGYILQPRMLERNRWWDVFASVAMASFSVPFFVFGAWAWYLHDTPVKDGEQSAMFKAFGDKLATAFPFVFSLIVGNAIKQLSAHKLEHGTTLISLEQTMGSLTLGSSVSTQILLRKFNFLSIFLICTWSLSPIGSQSSLQILSTGQRPIIRTTNISYFNMESTPGFSSGDIQNLPSLNALFSSILMAPESIRLSSMDLWGNVKIPDISRLSNISTSTSNSSWTTIPPSSSQNTTWASILGIPLSSVPSTGNTTFTLETSYLSLSCYDNITSTPINYTTGKTGFYNYTSLQNNTNIELALNGSLPNGTWYAEIGEGDPTNSLSFFRTFSIASNSFFPKGIYGLVSQQYINDTSPHTATTLLFQSLYGGVAAWFSLSTTYVEAQITCIQQSCSTTAIRPSTLKHANENLTNLGYIYAFKELTTYLMNTSAFSLHAGYSTALELYIVDPNLAPQAGLIYPSMLNVSTEDFASRFQQILNTYWYGSYDPVSMMTGLNTSNYLNELDSALPKTSLETQGTNMIWQDIFVCRFGWLAGLFLASSVMLGAAVAGAIIRLRVKGPDVLGWCSSLLRDSPYVLGGGVMGGRGGGRDVRGSGREMGGSYLGGATRARLWGSRKVRIVDVKPEEEVGWVAIAEVGVGRGGEKGGKALRKGRFYR